MALSLKTAAFMFMADLKQAVLWEILRKAANLMLRIPRLLLIKLNLLILIKAQVLGLA